MVGAQQTPGETARKIRQMAAYADCAQNVRALLRYATELERRADQRPGGANAMTALWGWSSRTG